MSSSSSETPNASRAVERFCLVSSSGCVFFGISGATRGFCGVDGGVEFLSPSVEAGAAIWTGGCALLSNWFSAIFDVLFSPEVAEVGLFGSFVDADCFPGICDVIGFFVSLLTCATEAVAAVVCFLLPEPAVALSWDRPGFAPTPRCAGGVAVLPIEGGGEENSFLPS